MGPQAFQTDELIVGSKTACCTHCFNTPNCFTYRWIKIGLIDCIVYKLATQQNPETGVSGGRCPLGVADAPFLTAQLSPASEFEYGICAAYATLT
jgi:hypothetical protein